MIEIRQPRSLLGRSSDLCVGETKPVSRHADRECRRVPGRRARPWIVLTLGALFAVLSLDASEQCQLCHPDEVREYLLTGMGRSLGRPNADQPSGVYYHGHSGTTFQIEFSDRGMVHRIQREGQQAVYSIDYVIGSENAAIGYLFRVDDALFQSPITYYSELKTWGMAPGMERYSDPDFTRPASGECLWCHAGRPRPLPGSVNRYLSPRSMPRAFRVIDAMDR